LNNEFLSKRVKGTNFAVMPVGCDAGWLVTINRSVARTEGWRSQTQLCIDIFDSRKKATRMLVEIGEQKK
jgi:hypothetical protein